MLFRHKPKNRRLGRESVLDVKLRSSQLRAARSRVAAVGLGALFATLLGGYLIWYGTGLALNALVYENKAFAIQEFDVQTDGVIAADQLRRWTGAKLGDNLLALDLARVRRDLELVPLIQSVSVERLLPHTLRLRVVERDAIAQINVPRSDPAEGIELAPFLIDAEGYVMVPLERHERTASSAPADEPLPLLGGINPNDVQPGRRIQSPQVQAALQLIPLFDRSAMAGLVDLKRVDVSSGDVLIVTTGEGSEVTFGSPIWSASSAAGAKSLTAARN